MPKQFRNNKKILAATVLTTALTIAPILSNADQPAAGTDIPLEGPVISTPSVAPSQDPEIDGSTQYEQSYVDPDAGQPAEPGEGPIISTPSVTPSEDPELDGSTVYEQGDLDTDAGQPAEPGEGPIVSTPSVDEFGNTVYEQGNLNPDAGKPAAAIKIKAKNTVSKKVTTENYNPKTGDSSMVGYVGLGLSSVLGLFRKRK